MTSSSPSTSASQRSRATAPMIATTFTHPASRRRVVRRDPPVMATIQRVTRRAGRGVANWGQVGGESGERASWPRRRARSAPQTPPSVIRPAPACSPSVSTVRRCSTSDARIRSPGTAASQPSSRSLETTNHSPPHEQQPLPHPLVIHRSYPQIPPFHVKPCADCGRSLWMTMARRLRTTSRRGDAGGAVAARAPNDRGAGGSARPPRHRSEAAARPTDRPRHRPVPTPRGTPGSAGDQRR